jgi:hypothetical protein
LDLKQFIFFIVLTTSYYSNSQCNIDENLNYYSTISLNNEAQFYDDDFRSELKRSLVKKISEFVGTRSEINVTQNKKKRKSKATYNAIALVVDPKFSMCGNIAIISVNRNEYKKAQYDNFRRQLEFHDRNINNFVNSMDDLVTKKLLKEKVKYYTKELNDISSLLPLVNLNKKDKELLNRFSKNVSILENLLDQLKQSKRVNFKKFWENLKTGVNDLIG